MTSILENEMHVPVNKVVRIDMTAKDVIHSFFVPQLRLKQDVVPRAVSSPPGSRPPSRGRMKSRAPSCAVSATPE